MRARLHRVADSGKANSEMTKLDAYLTHKAHVLAQRREDFSANPARARVPLKAVAHCAGTTGVRPVRMGDYIVISDSAPGLAGNSLGPSSPEMLLGALASSTIPRLPTGPTIVVFVSIIVGASLLFAPKRGIVAGARLRARQRWQFAQEALAVHLLQHEGGPNEAHESTSAHMGAHMRWDEAFASQVMERAVARGLVVRSDGSLQLTDAGRAAARRAMTR